VSAVRYEASGELALLHFDDGKANVVSPASIDALNEALDRAEREARGAVLYGRAGRFCAGFDLAVLNQGGAGMAELVKGGAELLARLYAFPLPLTVACTGHALGMGALMLLASDYRIGAEGDFRISLNEVAIGMTMPTFAAILATDRLSKRHLTRAVSLAEAYGPKGAVDAGFLDATRSGDVVGEATKHAESLLALDAKAHRSTKRAMRRHVVEGIRASLAEVD